MGELFDGFLGVDSPKVISVRENPEYAARALDYISGCWNEVPRDVYRDCIENSLGTDSPLPQWYLLLLDGKSIGCAGLIANDFISRQDLWPWLCALYIDPLHRGRGYPRMLIRRAMDDCAAAGFRGMYLSTDHQNYYERHGFRYMGQGYHPWGEESRIYGITIG